MNLRSGENNLKYILAQKLNILYSFLQFCLSEI